MRQFTQFQPWRRLAAGLLACALVVAALAATDKNAAAAPPMQEDEDAGVLIVQVLPESAAAEAGLRRGDILLAVDGETVDDIAALHEALADLEAGDEVEITYLHGDEERTVTLSLDGEDGRPFLGIVPFPGNMGVRVEAIPGGESPTIRMFRTPDTGAVIAVVVEGSAAEEAGLAVGEVILSVDGEEVDGGEALVEAIGSHAPGDTITLEVQPVEGETRTVEVTLGAREDDEEAAFLGVQVGGPGVNIMGRVPDEVMPFGFEEAVPFDFGVVPGRRLDAMMEGVLIHEVAEDSPAAEAGLAPGDLITEVDGEAVASFEALREIIADADPGDELSLTVQTLGMPPVLGREGDDDEEGEARTVVVTLGENEDGNAYLGITAAPFMFHMAPMGEGEAVPAQPCRCQPFEGEPRRGERLQGMPGFFFAIPARPFHFRGGPMGQESQEFRFYGGPQEGGRIEMMPMPAIPLHSIPARPFYFRGGPMGQESQEFRFYGGPQEGGRIEVTPAPAIPLDSTVEI